MSEHILVDYTFDIVSGNIDEVISNLIDFKNNHPGYENLKLSLEYNDAGDAYAISIYADEIAS